MVNINKDQKVLIWDIESLPAQAYIFDIYQGTNVDWIIKDTSIVTIAYRFVGEEKAKVISVLDFPKTFKKDVYDDSELLKAFSKIMNEADFTVAHYGDKFDMRLFNARVLRAGLEPVAPTKQIDTWRLAKRHFKLQSNKLDHLGHVLGIGKKIQTSKGLWIRCAQGERDAIEEMATYNRQDVDLLHDVFLKLVPYVKTTLNKSLGETGMCCSKCGSHNLQKRGTTISLTKKYQRYQCKDCGGWSSDKTSVPNLVTTTKQI